MGGLKFPRAARLHVRAEFDAVQDRGRRVTARYLTLIGRPNALERDRIGIIASRRVGGHWAYAALLAATGWRLAVG